MNKTIYFKDDENTQKVLSRIENICTENNIGFGSLVIDMFSTLDKFNEIFYQEKYSKKFILDKGKENE